MDLPLLSAANIPTGLQEICDHLQLHADGSAATAADDVPGTFNIDCSTPGTP